MKHSVLCRIAAVFAAIAIMFTMSACYQKPGGTLENTDAPTKNEATPTLPAEEGQLTLSLLLGIIKADMKWSQLSPYTHTAVDDTHATFVVADNYGKECTLEVAYDNATDAVTAATLSYEDVSVDVLTDNTLVIRTIMLAMNEE